MNREPEPPGAKEKILRAATKVFAEHGFGGARIELIAEDAGVNKASLYYHVGNKETLYATVMSRAADGMLQTLRAGIEQSEDGPPERFRAAIRAIAGRAMEDPHFAPLMLHEVATGGSVLPDEVVRKFSEIFSTVGSILRQGAADGTFRKFDPVLTHMLTTGGLLFLAAGTPLRERIRAELDGEAARHEQSWEELASEVSSILLEGLEGNDER